MRELSGDYISGASKDVRDVGVKAVIGTKTYLADDIISMDIQSTISGDGFGIGSIPSDRLSLKIYGADKLSKNTSIKIYTSFNNSGYEQLGLFYCEECTQSGKITSITAYDKMYSQSKKLCKFTGVKSLELSELSFPCTMQDILNYICTFRNITCNFECQPFVVQNKPKKSETEYYTVREILGFIASAHGCNARFNLDGELIFKEFSEASAGIVISDILDQDIDDSEPFTVNGIVFNVNNETQIFIDDNEGSEYDEDAEGIVSVDNPLASVEIAEYVWQKLGNLSYYGGDLSIRGMGVIECGDLIEVNNFKKPEVHDSYAMCITGISYSINRNNGFIETLTSKRNVTSEKASSTKQGDKPSLSPTSAIGQVTFEKNRLYYNGETYYLQFGANKRVMCVTKGNKYALINSYGYTESRIEAATAVMNGLTEDWDLEFDCDDPEINVQSLLNGNYSGGDERKYENGRVKIKLTGSVPSSTTISFNWFECEREKGNLIHIGGRLSRVNVLCNKYKAEHITFGENIKLIDGAFFNSPSTIENGHEHGVPPFIEYISGFIYSGSGYLYIPESCTYINGNTFACNSASEIEIEEEGGMLTVGEGAFRKSSSENGQLTVDVVKIPLRVSSSLYSVFYGLGARAIVFGKGITSLNYERIDYNSSYFPLIKDIPCYIFIPASVTSINSNLIYYEPTKYRNTFIIYEGSQSSWNNIAKPENWGSENSNVTVICDSSAYNNSESFINRFVRRS